MSGTVVKLLLPALQSVPSPSYSGVMPPPTDESNDELAHFSPLDLIRPLPSSLVQRLCSASRPFAVVQTGVRVYVVRV